MPRLAQVPREEGQELNFESEAWEVQAGGWKRGPAVDRLRLTPPFFPVFQPLGTKHGFVQSILSRTSTTVKLQRAPE